MMTVVAVVAWVTILIAPDRTLSYTHFDVPMPEGYTIPARSACEQTAAALATWAFYKPGHTVVGCKPVAIEPEHWFPAPPAFTHRPAE